MQISNILNFKLRFQDSSLSSQRREKNHKYNLNLIHSQNNKKKEVQKIKEMAEKNAQILKILRTELKNKK